MTIRVNCPGCGQEYKLADSLAGKKAKCKSCGGVVEIPASADDQLEDFDEPAPAKPAAKKPSVPPVPSRPASSSSAPPKPPPIPKAAAAAPALPKISVSCDMCFTDFQAKGELAGKKAKCPECGELVSVPGGKPKAKAKSKPVEDDDDDIVDDVAFVDDDEFEDDEPAPRRGASKGKDKKKSKGRRANAEYFIDTLPMPLVLGVMWTLIVFGCVMLVMFGKSNRNGAAMAGANGLFDAPPVAPATAGPATEPFNLGAIPVPPLPEPGAFQPSPFGTEVFSEAQFAQAGVPGGMMKVRIRLPNGQHAPQSLGCILSPPFPDQMLFGGKLSEPNQFQATMPYIGAGYAICEFSIDGPLSDDGDNEDESDAQARVRMQTRYKEFTDSCAGVVNARNALDFVLAKVPQVNPNRIYIAGQHHCGTIALLAAAHEPRIKGCMAYSPIVDCLNEDPEVFENEYYTPLRPSIREFLQRVSPLTHVSRLQCPVYVFQETGEDADLPNQGPLLQAEMTKLGRPIALETLPVGEDYDALNLKALNMSLAWLKKQPSEQPGGAAPAAAQTAPAEVQPAAAQPAATPIPGAAMP